MAAARGDTGEAKRFFDSGQQALETLGVAIDPDDRSELDWLSGQVALDQIEWVSTDARVVCAMSGSAHHSLRPLCFPLAWQARVSVRGG